MLSLNALVIDFETRSRVDLKTQGGHNYFTDPSTDILCMAAICLQSGREWLWFAGEPLPRDLFDKLQSATYVMAHNASFDQGIYEYVAVDDYKFPEIDPERWYCTAAQCRVNALPGALDDAARAITRGKHRKDHRGSALIRKLSIPQADGTFNEDPQLMQAMGEYCMQDVRLTVEIVKGTRLLTEQEHTDWLVNERINERGVLVDVDLCGYAAAYAAEEQAEIGEILAEITDGRITKHSQHQRIQKYVLEKVRAISGENKVHAVENFMTVYKKGEKKFSLDKSVRANILNAVDAGELEIPDDVYEVICLSDDGNKSSVAKFSAMLNRASPDDSRLRGAFMYAGAGQTKRYSSKGAQVHNFRRDCLNADEAEETKADMREGYAIEDVMNTLSKMLRPALVPEAGNVFVVGDWSAIEGRFLPWLSGDPRAEKVLDVFRDDEDIYMHTAISMNIDDRQIGKVSTLSLGYQGAVGAFSSMAKNYGLYLPEVQVKRIVKKWRAANQWAVDFWRKLEKAALLAVRNPGQEFQAGRVKYVYTRQLMGGTLFAILPNGDAIQYPFAKIEEQQSEYGTKQVVTYLKASVKPAADAKDWPRGTLYGGLMAENITQAISAALLREKLRELDAFDYTVVLHVHDEIVLEVPMLQGKAYAEALQKIMEEVPDWAEGLPLKAEPEIMNRYGK